MTYVITFLVLANIVVLTVILSAFNRAFVAHRQRNEAIHACVVAKQDAFRRDVAAFIAHPERGLPLNDGIRCPPIKP